MNVLLVYPNAHREIIGYMDMGAIAEPIVHDYGAEMTSIERRALRLRLVQAASA